MINKTNKPGLSCAKLRVTWASKDELTNWDCRVSNVADTAGKTLPTIWSFVDFANTQK